MPDQRLPVNRPAQTADGLTSATPHRVAPRDGGAVSLLISADDYGYSPRYDKGILTAARAGAVDAVGAMVLRAGCDPAPLLPCAITIGLHLELPAAGDQRGDTAVEAQVGCFERLFGRPPARLDGHHHRHQSALWRNSVARVAQRLGVPVRGVDAEHRRWLRGRGIESEDALVGRFDPDDRALPPIIAEMRAGWAEAPGAVEWMTHPGYADAGSGSAYDYAREEDLELLLSLAGDPVLRSLRGV